MVFLSLSRFPWVIPFSAIMLPPALCVETCGKLMAPLLIQPMLPKRLCGCWGRVGEGMQHGLCSPRPSCTCEQWYCNATCEQRPCNAAAEWLMVQKTWSGSAKLPTYVPALWNNAMPSCVSRCVSRSET